MVSLIVKIQEETDYPMDYEYKCRSCDELFTCEIAPTKEIRTRVCVKCIATYSKVERYFRVLRKRLQPKEVAVE